MAGNDVFHKFSAFIKNPVPAQDGGEQGRDGGQGGASCAPGRALTASPASSPVPAAAARPWNTSWHGSRSCVSRAAASWTATSLRWPTAACCPSCIS